MEDDDMSSLDLGEGFRSLDELADGVQTPGFFTRRKHTVGADDDNDDDKLTPERSIGVAPKSNTEPPTPVSCRCTLSLTRSALYLVRNYSSVLRFVRGPDCLYTSRYGYVLNNPCCKNEQQRFYTDCI